MLSSTTIMILTIIISIGLGWMSASLARAKGYNPLIWFFGGTGILGLIVVGSMTDVGSLPDDRKQQQRRKDNIIGFALAIISVLLLFVVNGR